MVECCCYKESHSIGANFSSSNKFCGKEDFMWYKERLYLCKNSSLKHKILEELHGSTVGGLFEIFEDIIESSRISFWKVLKAMFKNLW